jgi:CopG family nickel-responsive transcriptional regulator
MDVQNCLEVLILEGKAGQVKKLADEIISIKGVKHGKLTMTSKEF